MLKIYFDFILMLPRSSNNNFYCISSRVLNMLCFGKISASNILVLCWRSLSFDLYFGYRQLDWHWSVQKITPMCQSFWLLVKTCSWQDGSVNTRLEGILLLSVSRCGGWVFFVLWKKILKVLLCVYN